MTTLGHIKSVLGTVLSIHYEETGVNTNGPSKVAVTAASNHWELTELEAATLAWVLYVLTYEGVGIGALVVQSPEFLAQYPAWSLTLETPHPTN